MYNITINSLADDLGSNVIIDGAGATFTPGAGDVSIFNGATGNGFIQLNDTNAPLTGIEIKNINFTLDDVNNNSIYTKNNSGWICAGGTSKANIVVFSTCQVTSTGALTIDTNDLCGGICGGFNGSGGIYKFTSCQVTSEDVLTIGGGGG